MNSTRTMNSIRNSLFLQYPRKAGGQVTVAATVTAIMTNHCSSQEEKNFTQVKSKILPDFPQHPMLLFSLYKGAHSSVFSRLKTSTTATEVSHSAAKVFIAEIP